MVFVRYCFVVLLCISVACGGGGTDSPTAPSPTGALPTAPNASDPDEPLNGPGLTIQGLSPTMREGNRYEITLQVREVSRRWPVTITSIVVAYDNGGTINFDNPLAVFESATVAAGAVADSRRLQLIETQGRAVARSVTVTVNFRDDITGRTGTVSSTAAVRDVTGPRAGA